MSDHFDTLCIKGLNQNLTGLSQNLLAQNLDREGLQALQYVDRVLQKLMPGFFFEDFPFSKDLYFWLYLASMHNFIKTKIDDNNNSFFSGFFCKFRYQLFPRKSVKSWFSNIHFMYWPCGICIIPRVNPADKSFTNHFLNWYFGNHVNTGKNDRNRNHKLKNEQYALVL